MDGTGRRIAEEEAAEPSSEEDDGGGTSGTVRPIGNSCESSRREVGFFFLDPRFSVPVSHSLSLSLLSSLSLS
jgi:hypothetical protein